MTTESQTLSFEEESEEMGSLLNKAAECEEAVDGVSAVTEAAPRKRKQSSSKARNAGRPLKRVSNEALGQKISKMKEQRVALHTKLTELDKRLAKHEDEARVRDEQHTQDQDADAAPYPAMTPKPEPVTDGSENAENDTV